MMDKSFRLVSILTSDLLVGLKESSLSIAFVQKFIKFDFPYTSSKKLYQSSNILV